MLFEIPISLIKRNLQCSVNFCLFSGSGPLLSDWPEENMMAADRYVGSIPSFLQLFT